VDGLVNEGRQPTINNQPSVAFKALVNHRPAQREQQISTYFYNIIFDQISELQKNNEK
jgi:hypothetical protein